MKKKRCEMIGCKKEMFTAYVVAPGTILKLCRDHYDEIKSEKEGL